MKDKVPDVPCQMQSDKRLARRQGLPKWIRFSLAYLYFWIGCLFSNIGDNICRGRFVWPYGLYQYFMVFSSEVDTDNWVWCPASELDKEWYKNL